MLTAEDLTGAFYHISANPAGSYDEVNNVLHFGGAVCAFGSFALVISGKAGTYDGGGFPVTIPEDGTYFVSFSFEGEVDCIDELFKPATE
jgi:hypothetical protein